MKTRETQYQAAIKKIEEANKILREIQKDFPRDYDCRHFACELDDLLSSDSGEAGLKPFFDNFIKGRG